MRRLIISQFIQFYTPTIEHLTQASFRREDKECEQAQEESAGVAVNNRLQQESNHANPSVQIGHAI